MNTSKATEDEPIPEEDAESGEERTREGRFFIFPNMFSSRSNSNRRYYGSSSPSTKSVDSRYVLLKNLFSISKDG